MMYSDRRETMRQSGVSIRELSDGIAISMINIDLMKSIYFSDQSVSNAALPADLFIEVCDDWNIHRGDRFGTFRTFKRQTEWIAGRIAFNSLDELYFGGGHTLAHLEGGAPVIEGIPNPVSITHSGKYAAAAISLNPDISLGIDIERIRSFDNRDSFLRVAFPEDESIRASDLSDKDIIRMWTLKESFLKILGLGFAENLRNVRILQDCFIYKGSRVDSLKRDITEFDGHILSTVWGTLSL